MYGFAFVEEVEREICGRGTEEGEGAVEDYAGGEAVGVFVRDDEGFCVGAGTVGMNGMIYG